MGETLFFLAAFGFIWGAWGFWVSLATFIGCIVIAILFKPRYSYETNWGTVLAKYGTIALGIMAINAIWANIIVTAIAVAVVVVVVLLEK